MLTALNSEALWFIIADMSNFEKLVIRVLCNIWVEYGFLISSGYLEEVLESVDVAHQDLVHERNLEVLWFDFKLKYFMFELYFTDEFLGIKIQCGYLVACELLLRRFSLFKYL